MKTTDSANCMPSLDGVSSDVLADSAPSCDLVPPGQAIADSIRSGVLQGFSSTQEPAAVVADSGAGWALSGILDAAHGLLPSHPVLFTAFLLSGGVALAFFVARMCNVPASLPLAFLFFSFFVSFGVAQLPFNPVLGTLSLLAALLAVVVFAAGYFFETSCTEAAPL
jgi:hypothetical protein